MTKLLLLINTVKYLKWRQVYFRILRKVIKPKITDSCVDICPARGTGWVHLALYKEKIDLHLNACFLNHSKKLVFPDDWNSEIASKLWVYNLHYFEDLLASNVGEKREFHKKLLNRWIDENPIGFGNGWEPYPTSLRIVNILKAWLGGLDLDEKLFKSVFLQTSYLSNDLEKHLLGNHYFVNLKALLFAGVIFENHRWKKIAEDGLVCEIPEQILKDGANFELSPMYHSLMLVDMLDLYNLLRAYPGHTGAMLNALLEIYIPKMLSFAAAMAHPDGGLSYFNDSVDGVAPKKTVVESYARKLGFETQSLDKDTFNLVDNVASGYFCAIGPRSKLVFDASSVGPEYIPGHAHADTLSLELSIGTERVIVNSGISEYGLNDRRLYQRKTKAHNTVEVDNKDSSEVWSGFRVAKRARIVERYSKKNADNSILLGAAHSGYKTLFGGCIHSRQIVLNDGYLMISDELQGVFKNAKSRYYFHPNLKVNIEDNTLRVIGDAFILTSDLTGKRARLEESVWHPEFGKDISNKMLLIELSRKRENISFIWAYT